MTRRLTIKTLAAFICAAILAVSLSPSVSADTVCFVDGGSQEGRVIYESNAEVWIEVATANGKAVVKVPRSSVAKIVKGETLSDKIEAMYKDKEAAMDPGKAIDWFKLGEWCEQHGILAQKARNAFERAISVDPDYGPAHQKLGHVKYEGVWMTYDEMMLARGYVKYRGEWVTVDGKVALMLRDKDMEIERERRLAAEAASRKAEYEKQLAEKSAEKEMAHAVTRETAERTIYVEERAMSPFWYMYPTRMYSFPGDYCPPPYYIRYPYRSGYHYPAPCGGVYVHYTKKSPHSSFRVGFVFR